MKLSGASIVTLFLLLPSLSPPLSCRAFGRNLHPLPPSETEVEVKMVLAVLFEEKRSHELEWAGAATAVKVQSLFPTKESEPST